MISRESWISVMQEVLRRYMCKREPFVSGTLYGIIPPDDNDALLAKIDIERALACGCKGAKEIVDFLQVCEEGWFFEQKAEYFEVLRALTQERRSVS
ncbi:hypothetical protein [Atrimonas thermophila]|uniref:hypothetical protein n=1 Tax=Atrimonas thermophila TaxID=3064161 RepID=UPI00399D2B1C